MNKHTKIQFQNTQFVKRSSQRETRFVYKFIKVVYKWLTWPIYNARAAIEEITHMTLITNLLNTYNKVIKDI